MVLLLGVRFLAELAMLAALGWVGYRVGDGHMALSVTLAVALPVLAAATWGRWVAPRARQRLTDPWRLSVEIVLFGAAACGLAILGEWAFAAVLSLMYAVSAPTGRAAA